MAANPILLIDINVILDVLIVRKPFYLSSARFLALAETGKINGYVAGHGVTTIFYVLQKHLSNDKAHAYITSLLQFIKVAPVNQQTIDQALKLTYKDFEDAVQMISAVQIKADALITRNIKDFQPPLLPVIQPIDYLSTINK